jgi:chemotaxis protein CheC
MNLTLNQIGALTGLINTGVGRSAGMLNEMVNTRVYLQVPPIKVFPPLEAKRELERLGRNRLATV